MILDGHIHIHSTQTRRDLFLARMAEAGVDGGVVLSAFPETWSEDARPFEERLEHVLTICQGMPLLFPFLFIDPAAENAVRQVECAVEAGVAGFKAICNKFYPSDPRCMEVYRAIAAANKPVLFHSGILWDGLNASGRYNRPVEFEPLLSIPGLRFALAHISWPWCDECVAVYGKFDQAMRTGATGGGRMLIDNTPGTPKIYREDALRKVIGTGYQVLDSLFFGTDNMVEDYNVAWARDWIQTDRAIYRGLGLDEQQMEDVFARNLLGFIQGSARREA